MSRLLALLVSGPFPKQQSFCEALLVVEAGHAASGFHAAETGSQTGVDRAREAARKLLAGQRGNLGLWAAYAGLESQARQYKVGSSICAMYANNTAKGTATTCLCSLQQPTNFLPSQHGPGPCVELLPGSMVRLQPLRQ